jgi:DNA-binding NtrC family response regulator
MKASILIVDDEESIRFTFEKMLLFVGFEVVTAATCREARDRIERLSFQLVIADIILPDGTGIDLFKAIKREQPESQVILITAYPSEETSREMLQMGVFAYLPKPLRQHEVLGAVAAALSASRLSREPSGDSPAMTVVPGYGSASPSAAVNKANST